MASWLDRFLYNIRAGPVFDPGSYCNYYPCQSTGGSRSGSFSGIGDVVIGSETNKSVQMIALAAIVIFLAKGFSK